MKKLASFVLALCLLLGVGASAEMVNTESAMPVVTEPFEVDIAFVPQSAAVDFKIENNAMAEYLKRESGLTINWTLIDSVAAEERISMMCNSGDLPDAILGYSFDANKLVQYGVSEQLFMPLNDLIDQYAPTLAGVFAENPSWKAAVTATDGNIYGFPAFSNIWNYPLRFFINTVWLDNVGLENPTTLEEFKQVLIAFRDQDANGNGDPSDEIPWSGSWSEGNSERNFIFNSYGYVSNSGGYGNIALDYNQEGAPIVFVPATDMYKEYLYFMRDLWNEGLLDPDMFTQSKVQEQATVMEGVVGFTEMDAPYVYDPENQEDWECINTLVSEEGKTPVFPGVTGINNMAMMVINADVDEDTAAVLTKFADWFYTLEGWGFATYGPEAGSEYDYFNNGHYYDEATNTILYNRPAEMTSDWTHRVTNLTFYSVPGFNQTGYDPYRLEYAEVYPDTAIGQQFKNGVVCRDDEKSQQEKQSPYYVTPVPNFFFSEEDLDRLTALQTPLDDYVALMEAQFITGEQDIDAQYDTFQETLVAYGLEEYMEIYQQYYENFKANQQ